jgi:streptogrisin D
MVHGEWSRRDESSARASDAATREILLESVGRRRHLGDVARRSAVTSAGVIVSVTGLALFATPAASSGVDGSAPPEPSQWVESDVVQAAKDLGVPASVIVEEREITPAVAAIQARLRSDPDFAGLWIEKTTEIRVVVAFTRDAEGRAAGLTTDFPDRVDVRGVSADWSLNALESVFSKVQQAARDAELGNRRFDLWIDQKANTVRATAVDGPAKDWLEKTAGSGAPLEVSVGKIAVPEACRADCYPNAYGGISGNSCSAGFTAIRGGVLGILSASHCSDALANGTHSLGPVVVAKELDNVDAQWHALPSGWLNPSAVLLTDAPTFRSVNSVQSASGDFVGQTVCKSGQATGYTCGQITGLNYAPGFIPFSFGFRTASYASEGGDSGAPVFADTSAVGIHAGKIVGGSQNAIYGHIANVQAALGTNVSTK